MYVYIHVCTCVSVYVCTYVCTCTCAFTCMLYVHVCIHMCVHVLCVYVHIRVCVNSRVCTCVYSRVCVDVGVHTCGYIVSPVRPLSIHVSQRLLGSEGDHKEGFSHSERLTVSRKVQT